MARYSLVAIKYCNNNVIDEVEIKLDGARCSNLIGMDKFTSGINFYDLWNQIRSVHDLDDSYELVIKYVRNRKERPVYYGAIIDNKTINSCCRNTNYSFFDDKGCVYVIIKRDPYFLRVYESLINIIDTYKFEDYRDIYFYNNDKLLELVKEYVESNDKRLLDSIKEELSIYVTFRKFIVNLERLRKQKLKKRCIASKEELAENYNRRFLDEDKEEFIESCEVEQMGLYDTFGLKRSIGRH